MTILELKINIARLIDNSIRKIYYFFYYKKLNPSINYNKVNKVVFVAHPDDEFIFLGGRLLNEDDWLVVCMTNGDNIKRSREFVNLMKTLNLQYKILNFKDGPNISWNREKSETVIENILKEKEEWSVVVTHNNEGEYGHYQHKQLNQIVKKVARKNIKVFSHERTLKTDEKKLAYEISKKKLNYARMYYTSQMHVINNNDMKKYFYYEGLDIE